MGRKSSSIKCPRGVSLREFPNETRIQIAFSYKGVQCRELMPPSPITQTTINLAAGRRAEIQRHIADEKAGRGVFAYADYFPGSARAAKLESGGLQVMLTKLLQKTLEGYEHQEAHGTMAKSTVDGYRKAINSQAVKEWAEGRAIASIRPSDLRELIRGYNTTAKRVRNVMTPLRATFADALNDDLIKVDPFDRIAMEGLLKKTTTASDYEPDPYTKAERAALIKAARADEWPTVQFWLATGLRSGELIANKWSKIDWTNRKNRIDVNQVAGIEKLPKTKAGIRDVDLSEEAISALVAQKTISFESGSHIFLNPRTAKPWTTDAQIRKTLWGPLCERADVRYRNPYQCRHTFASALLTDGANPWYVAEQLGHEDAGLVFSTYGKFIPQDYQKPKAQSHLRAVQNDGSP